MKTTSITTGCISCHEAVDGAQHVLLCDECSDARLADLERTHRWSAGRRAARGWQRRALRGEWKRALALGAPLRAA
jgi:hypothetical protein